MCPEDAIGLRPLLRTYYSMREHEVIRSTAGSDSRHYVGSVAPSRQNLSALRPPVIGDGSLERRNLMKTRGRLL
jgi:hypothetical protein